MTATFKKGQTATLVRDWDRKGTVTMTPVVVYSCGKKQMVLTHAQTGEELGRNFKPIANAEGWAGEYVLTGEATDEQILEVAAQIQAARRAQIERRTTLTQFGEGYVAAAYEDLNELHALTIIRK